MAKMIKNGHRVSSYLEYIKNVQNTRVNLTVIPYSTVTEVLINEAKRAHGVAFLRHGIPQLARASKEVIISSGTMVSPVLLMRSGVGPRQVLEEAGIPVKHELNEVGQNLVDHVYVTLEGFKFSEKAKPFLSRVPENKIEEEFNNYLETGTGVFGELQEGPQAFLVSERAKRDKEPEWPDHRLTMDHSCPVQFDDNAIPTVCFYVNLDRPKSRGFLTLNASAYRDKKTTEYTDLTIVQPNMNEDMTDIEVLLEGIETLFTLTTRTNFFRELTTQYDAPQESGCKALHFGSDEYWRCFIRQNSNSALHMTGTCSMGKVVDTKFRVLGINGLRVVDASVLPQPTNANLNAGVLMLAEKASDNIISP